MDETDTAAVTERLMNILEIRNKREQAVEIKEYLAALDLIVDCPIETTEPGMGLVEHILFTQPGMRYCLAQALAYALMKDGTPSIRAATLMPGGLGYMRA